MLFVHNFYMMLQPHECKVLIDKIKACASDAELLDELSQIKCWTYGKVCFVDTTYACCQVTDTAVVSPILLQTIYCKHINPAVCRQGDM